MLHRNPGGKVLHRSPADMLNIEYRFYRLLMNLPRSIWFVIILMIMLGVNETECRS